MLTGTYSSVFVAAPTLALLKLSSEAWRKDGSTHVIGEDLRTLVLGGSVSRRARSSEGAPSDAGISTTASSTAASVLQHEPRPRKKRRRS